MTESSSSDHYLLGEEESAFRRYRLFNEIYQPTTAERFSADYLSRTCRLDAARQGPIVRSLPDRIVDTRARPGGQRH